MMAVVYILSRYDDCGACNVSATADSAKVPAMLDAYLPSVDDYHRTELAKAMDVGTPGRYDISPAWGGYLLHIVELDAPPQDD